MVGAVGRATGTESRFRAASRWIMMLLEAWTRSAFELAPLSLASKASFSGLS